MSILRAKTLDLRQTRELTSRRQLNSELNLREAQEQKIVLNSLPRRLVFELTNACNLNCVMCGRNAADFHLTKFDFDWIHFFDDVLESIEEVTLMGWGEPTIHPDFKLFLRWAFSKGLRKYFCTNGMTLDQLEDEIFNTEVDIIAVSLDGANAEMNDKIRRGSSFDRVLENVSSIVKRKSTWPYVNFVYTLMHQNINQLPKFIEIAADVGVEEVKAVYLTAFNRNMIKEVLFKSESLVEKVFEKAFNVAQRVGISIKLPHIPGKDPAGSEYHKTCYTAWRDFFLGSDGYVRSCMSTSEKMFHIDKYNKDFMRMWNSDELIAHRGKVNADSMSRSCKYCYQSSYANWNRKESFLRLDDDFSPNWIVSHAKGK